MCVFMYNSRYLTVPTNVHFRNVSVSYLSLVIAASVFVYGVFVFVSDFGVIYGNENNKAYFRPFPFIIQPGMCVGQSIATRIKLSTGAWYIAN
jgi:hypothetical protein